MLVPVLLTVFVCVPLAVLGAALLSRTGLGSVLGLSPWVPSRSMSWLTGVGAAKPGRFSEVDWLHFERLLGGHSVPAAAQEPAHHQRAAGGIGHEASRERVAGDHSQTAQRYEMPPRSPYESFGRLARIAIAVVIAVASLSVLSIVFGDNSNTSMSSALAGSITSRVALSTVTQADVDRTTVTVASSDLPDVVKRAAGIGFNVQCDDGVALGSGPALAPSSRANDWTTCSGSLGGYDLHVEKAGTDAVQVVLEPALKAENPAL